MVKMRVISHKTTMVTVCDMSMGRPANHPVRSRIALAGAVKKSERLRIKLKKGPSASWKNQDMMACMKSTAIIIEQVSTMKDESTKSSISKTFSPALR